MGIDRERNPMGVRGPMAPRRRRSWPQSLTPIVFLIVAVLAFVIIVNLAACSGEAGDGGDSSSESATTTPPTTAASPADAFVADLEANLTTGDDPTMQTALVDYARAECVAIDAATQVATGDAANDTPESDAAITGQAVEMAIGLAWGPDGLGGRGFDDAAIDFVMRSATEHFCPQHTDAVDAYIAAH